MTHSASASALLLPSRRSLHLQRADGSDVLRNTLRFVGDSIGWGHARTVWTPDEVDKEMGVSKQTANYVIHKDGPDSVEVRSRAGDARQFSPSAARNCAPIREMLIRVLPKKGIALEIGSGTGEHVICFAKALPRFVWLPSDPDSASRASIKAWSATEGLANVRAPVAIDVREDVWDVEDDAPFDAIISLNMVHIAPWDAALGLLAGAGRLLRPDGVLFFYGPFMLGGAHTSASNAAFDADLKGRDPRWGVRDVDELVSEAAPHGLELREVVKMPANNLSLVFVKAGPALPA